VTGITRPQGRNHADVDLIPVDVLSCRSSDALINVEGLCRSSSSEEGLPARAWIGRPSHDCMVE
jgi:hypothetical protein